MPDHPPKPRLAFSVGITGHRPDRLTQSEAGRVTVKISALLKQLSDAIDQAGANHPALFEQDTPRLSLISNLAEGADRIAAEAALAQNFLLEAALPFHRDEFEKDFSDDASIAHFRDLLVKANAVLELPGSRRSSPRAYERASEVMLDHAAMLIAVWDGEAASGRGGTRATIDEAARRGMPIIIIDSKGQRPPQIRWRDLHSFPGLETNIEDLEPRDVTADLALVIDRLIRPPSVEAHEDEPGHLKDYLDEKRRRWQLRQGWQWLMGMAFVRKPRFSDWRAPDPDEIAQAQMPATDKRASILTHAFGWADALAIYYAQIFRSAFIANFVFAALSVAIVAVSILVQKSFHALPHEKWIFVTIELLMISAVIINTRIGHRQDWHRRWLEAREVAERLRVALPMRFLGANPMQSQGVPGVWTAWYGRALLRSVGLPTGSLAQSQLTEGRKALVAMLEEQAKYHEATAIRMEKVEKRIEHFGEVLFFATILVALFYLLATKAAGLHLSDEAKFAVTALTAGLPVLATASYGIRIIADFEGMARRSERMAETIEILLDAIASDPPDDLDKARDRAQQAVDLMLGDVSNWRIAAEGRGLAIPG